MPSCTVTNPLPGLLYWLALSLLVLAPELGLPDAAYAQSLPDATRPTYRYDTWTTEDGLPQNWVYAIEQTDDGYLWLGTGSGLARFDGLRFKVFDQSTSPALPDNEIRRLHQDDQGTLWIGGVQSLTAYREGAFEPLSLAGDTDIGLTRGIFQANDKASLWFMAEDRAFHRQGDTLVSIPFAPTSESLGIDDIQQNLFVWKDSLYYTPRGTTLAPVHAGDGTLVRGQGPILLDQQQVLWVGGFTGLQRLTAQGPPTPVTEIDARIQSLYEDRSGTLWVGTQNRGVFQHIGSRFEQVLDLTAPASPFYEDREGNLWIGTIGAGLLRIKAPAKFTTYTRQDGLADDLVWTILDAQQEPGIRWFGTDRGLSRLRDGQYTTFTTADGLPHDRVFSLYEDTDGSLWIGTDEGLARYDGQRITAYPFSGFGDVSIGIRGAIYRDRSGTLWVGAHPRRGATNPSGLAQVIDGAVTRVEVPEGLEAKVRGMHEAHDGTLWFGTSGDGLLQYRNGAFRVFTTEDGLPNSVTQSFLEEADSTLWITTRGGGLARYRDGRFQVVGTEHGLFDETIHHILEDEQGFFWMSTNRGIFRVHKADLHAVAEGTAAFVTSIVYDQTDGLLSIECNSGNPGVLHDQDGQFWFPTLRGAATIDPNNIQINSIPPPVIIEALRADYAPVGLTENLTLPPGTRGLAFDYTGLSFVAPEHVHFKYRLDGYNRDWVNADTRRTAFYTNIPPGRYTFRVQAANNDGVWNETGASLSFVLQPHFYQTPWFYGLAVLSLFGLGFLVYRYRLRQLRERELIALVEARTAGLQAEQRKTKAQAEKLEDQARQLIELDRMKTRFFANISHEFRTPLTLTIGPLEDALQSPDPAVSDRLRTLLETPLRNARRLLALINQLLDVSKLEAGKMTLRAREDDLVRFVRERVKAFSSLAEKRQIRLGVTAEVETLLLYFEADKLEKVIFNLISNALKYTPPEGKVLVTVAQAETEALFTVQDTGHGIPDAQLPYVFDRFFQATEDARPRQAGTGIGLSLTQELVRLHGGEIEVESTHGFGSTFTVRLPLGKAHLTPEQLADEPPEPVPTGESPTPPLDPDLGVGLHPAGSHTQRPDHDTKILVVEDDPEVRHYVASHFASTYQILEATDGLDGLEQAREAMPELIISDVMMPGLDGFALCHKLKTDARTSHIPVLLLTARASQESKLEGLELGADDYLAKPFNARELQARAENLIASRRKLRARFSRENATLTPAEVAVTPADEAFLEHVLATVEAHMSDGRFGVFELAEELGLSRRQLHRKLKALTDQAPADFIRHLRLQRAAQLLKQRYGTVSEVAFAVGFNKLSHFSALFSKTFGMPPSEYAAAEDA